MRSVTGDGAEYTWKEQRRLGGASRCHRVDWKAAAEVEEVGSYHQGVLVLGTWRSCFVCWLSFVETSLDSVARWALNLWFSCFPCVRVLGLPSGTHCTPA